MHSTAQRERPRLHPSDRVSQYAAGETTTCGAGEMVGSNCVVEADCSDLWSYPHPTTGYVALQLTIQRQPRDGATM